MSNGTAQRSQQLCNVLLRPSAEGTAWALRDRRAPAKAPSLTHSPPRRASRDKPLALSLSILAVLFLVGPSSATVSACSNIISMPACSFGVWPRAVATVVILVPESGDTIQTMKAGIMEIADLFVINKADRDGADRLVHELRMLVHTHPPYAWWEIP